MKFFLTNRFYYLAIGLTVMFVAGYYFSLVYSTAYLLFFVLMIFVGIDSFMLFFSGGTITVSREVNDRLSNGDENKITLAIESTYRIKVSIEIKEELPDQLQIRDFSISKNLKPGEALTLGYSIFPKERGSYSFGVSNVLTISQIGLVMRRIKAAKAEEVRVYPSFIHINNIELAAISNKLIMVGQKRIQKVGNSQEFDSIRPYVLGDDPRRLNWKATAKKNALQVNHFVDEKSQSLYCLIDKSRAMKMPFEGLSLLDYAINASLVLSHVALKKGDQAGLLTFEDQPATFIKASTQHSQIHHIMEALHREETSFNEVDFTTLYSFTSAKIHQRSLFLLYTNFESIHSLERQLPYLKLLNRKHLLLVVFFKNTEVNKVIEEEAISTQGIFTKVMAHQLLNEKNLINEKLRNSGILTLYTSPENLSTDVINKYIEIKNRRIL